MARTRKPPEAPPPDYATAKELQAIEADLAGAGLTPADLARALGISRAAVSRWFSKGPTRRRLVRRPPPSLEGVQATVRTLARSRR